MRFGLQDGTLGSPKAETRRSGKRAVQQTNEIGRPIALKEWRPRAWSLYPQMGVGMMEKSSNCRRRRDGVVTHIRWGMQTKARSFVRGRETRRIRILVLVVAALAFTNGAKAGDAYDNQIQMAGTLLQGSPASFQEFCSGIGGTHYAAGDKAKCVRGMTTLMIAFSGQSARLAMVAYPATPKDIQGLWSKATAVLGKPDEAKENQLTWFLEEGLFASAVYDDEHSMFVLGIVEGQ